MSRKNNIAFKWMPDGDIRAFQSNTSDKRGVAELQITNIDNISPTIISSRPPNIWLYESCKKYYPIGRERTEEEKKRRHLYGDKGAKFSQSKRMCILPHGVMGAITTFATKDCLVCEVYE